MCVLCTEHLNIVLHVWCLSIAWWYSSLFRSFNRLPCPCTQAHIRWFHLRVCDTSSIGSQLHLQRNNNFFSRLSLAHTASAIIAHKTIRSKKFRHLKSELEKTNFPQSIRCLPLIDDAIECFFQLPHILNNVLFVWSQVNLFRQKQFFSWCKWWWWEKKKKWAVRCSLPFLCSFWWVGAWVYEMNFSV